MEILDYALLGFQLAWKIPLTRYMSVLILLLLILFFRRLSNVFRSGGDFFSPFRIAKDNLYVHNAIFFGKRIIPLSEIKAIECHRVRGRLGSGRRYVLFIEKKQGKTAALIFGKSEKNDRLVKNLSKLTKKYNITIRLDLQGW